MTERQRRFAAKNHNLIYRYLHEKGWEVSEYYDIAAFGYLRAVRRYLTEPGLSHIVEGEHDAVDGKVVLFRQFLHLLNPNFDPFQRQRRIRLEIPCPADHLCP